MAIRSANYSHWITHNYCKPQPHHQDAFQVEEFDSFHFVENNPIEDFYVNSSPSEDIWKKFELIPTPPLSPRRDEVVVNGVLSPCSTSEKLRLVSEKLDDPISYTVISDDYFAQDITNYFQAPVSPTGSTVSNSSSSTGLITDCMWSAQFKNKADSVPKPKVTIRLEKADLSSYITETSHSDDCVEPSAVFPFPISDARCMRSNLEAQPDSAESSESDEEIDVVTVPKLSVEKMRSILPIASSRNPNSLLNPASLLNLTQTQRPTVHILADKSRSTPPTPQPTKVISLKRKSLSLPASPEPKEKKLKRENSVPELTKLVSPSKKSMPKYRYLPEHTSYRMPSDDEDSVSGFYMEPKEKRAQHNVLERKRRYDLKYSFMVLRDVIPQLETQERAAKVVILQKAVECIEDLEHENDQLERRKDYERRRHEALERKLDQLRMSFCY